MAAKVDADLVRHIGMLSRIELSDEQVRMFGEQLAAILSYVEKLQELDTTDVEPMAHALDVQNVLAEDTLGQSLRPETALANAPQRDGDFFKVPKVLADS